MENLSGEDWRLIFVDHEGRELNSTYSFPRPDDANLMVSRFRNNPTAYNVITPDGEIVSAELVDFGGEILVRLMGVA